MLRHETLHQCTNSFKFEDFRKTAIGGYDLSMQEENNEPLLKAAKEKRHLKTASENPNRNFPECTTEEMEELLKKSK